MKFLTVFNLTDVTPPKVSQQEFAALLPHAMLQTYAHAQFCSVNREIVFLSANRWML